jgi:hypothetical protein
MKTFLAQNQFISNACAPSLNAQDAAGEPPPPSSPAVTNPDRGYMSHRLTPALGTSVSSAAIDSCQEPVAADNFTSDIPEVFRAAANYLRRYESRFVPDKAAIWDAMFDEAAPRALETDPVWADPAPIFLKDPL